MFLETSRYYQVAQVEATARGGRPVRAVKLRRLPAVSGSPTLIKEHDRLDILSQRRYANPTMFWHIADANTELEATDLAFEPGRIINVPER